MRRDFAALRETVRGSLLTPYDAGYEQARVLFNTSVRTRPAALCRCVDTADVVAAVRFARDSGIPIAVRGGGHHASGLSLVQDGLVIDVGGMRDLTFDPTATPPTVTVGPGIGWRDIDQVTYVDHTVDIDGVPHGLAAPGGECPTVSNAGYSLGGGYGPLTRRFGLGCDHLIEVELVDAGGQVLHVSDHEHPDLMWALRGAGSAGFGVVTRLTYRLNPVPKTLIGGVIAWPIERADDVFRAYRDLYSNRDDDRLALSLLLSTDPYPDGPKAIAVYGLYVGHPADAGAALAPLRKLGEPLYDAFEPTSYFEFMQVLGGEIPYGLQSKWRGGYFQTDGLDETAFVTMIDHFRAAPSGYSMVRFDLLGGGAVARVPADATAFAHRSSVHYVSLIAMWQDEHETDANVAWVDQFADALRPALNGEVYQNYADRDLADWPIAYHGAHYSRLQQIKLRYDPTDEFHYPQSIRLP